MKFELSPEQLDVVYCPGSRILINASPGTAKTTVLGLVAIKHSLQLSDSPSLDSLPFVLVTTLTNYAANKTKQSICELLNNHELIQEVFNVKETENVIERIQCCTLHSLSFRMVKRFRGKSLNGYNVVDNEIFNDLVEEATTDHGKDMKEIVMRLLSIPKVDEEKVSRFILSRYPEYSKLIKTINHLMNQLLGIKKEEGWITYDDMLIQFDRLLSHEKIRQIVQSLYPAILVDEFQDTGRMQWKILKRMVGPKTKILVAGDDCQTIFTWNGASFKRFRHFQKRFPRCRVLPLSVNYRSAKPIVDLSNALISLSHYATKREITAVNNHGAVKIKCIPDLSDRLNYVNNVVKKRMKEGVALGDIAILYRAYPHAGPLHGFLEEKKIPYQVFGDKAKRNRPLVRLIFAFIQILESRRFETSTWRNVLSKLDGIGERRIGEIIEWIQDKEKDETLYPKNHKYREPLQDLLRFIYGLKNLDSGIVVLRDIFNFVKKLPKVNRSENEHIRPTLFKLAFESDDLSGIIEKYNDYSFPLCYPHTITPPFPEQYLNLSSVHKSKGGEFDTVIYWGTDDEFYMRHGLFDDPDKMEGELQTMNVAVTRARKELHLLFPIDREAWDQDAEACNPWKFVRKADGWFSCQNTKVT